MYTIGLVNRPGRKDRTYIFSDKNFEESEIKQFLKDCKQLFNTNGCCVIENNMKVIHLRGDQRENLRRYLIHLNNVSENEIIVNRR